MVFVGYLRCKLNIVSKRSGLCEIFCYDVKYLILHTNINEVIMNSNAICKKRKIEPTWSMYHLHSFFVRKKRTIERRFCMSRIYYFP